MLLNNVAISPKFIVRARYAIRIYVVTIPCVVNILENSSNPNKHLNVILFAVFTDLDLNLKLWLTYCVPFKRSVTLDSPEIVSFTPAWEIVFIDIYEIWTFILIKLETDPFKVVDECIHFFKSWAIWYAVLGLWISFDQTPTGWADILLFAFRVDIWRMGRQRILVALLWRNEFLERTHLIEFLDSSYLLLILLHFYF